LVKGNKENTLLISGRGSLPEDPKQYLRGQAVWQDLRMLNDEGSRISSNYPQKSEHPIQKAIIEAQNWQVNPQGKVELVATKDDYPEFNFAGNYLCK